MEFSVLRRCFQFRLGTWFVLVAILAWAMLQQPLVVTVPGPPVPNATPVVSHAPLGNGFVKYAVPTTERLAPNPGLRGPAYALFGFLIWRGVALRQELAER